MSRDGIWSALAERLEQGEPAFLALVVANTRHSPGTAGARLLVTRDGARGTIGGGVMEHRVVERARTALASGAAVAELQTLHHRRDADGEPSGLICAGSQTNLYYLCRPRADGAAVARLAALTAAGRSGTLRFTAGGMDVVEEPPDLARPPRRLARPAEGWSYEEELLNRRRLAVLGGGHCALALARLMRGLGYHVTACEAAAKPPAPGLADVVDRLDTVADFRDAAALILYPELTWVVVMTSAFPTDARALEGALPHPFPFLGVMGSPAKLTAIKKSLTAAGATPADLARLRAPVGLPIKSNTPEEIAVSVAAQILQERPEGG